MTMEKNGNTFVPGDRVSTHEPGQKISQRRIGQVCPESHDGKVKIAWSDGTSSWESPDELTEES